MQKKLLRLAVGVCTIFGLSSCTGTTSSATGTDVTEGAGEGEVLNIRCWNDEFQGRFRSYYPDYMSTDSDGNDLLRDGTKIVWTITANKDNAYQNALDVALKGNDAADDDDKVDMYLVEADYALKYVDSDYSLDVKKDLGLTDNDLSQQYQYTKDIVTDSTGAQKGTTWQACPGLYAYRRDIAKEVLGTDDPTEVQKQLSTWDGFNAVAAAMKEKGYFMLSGYDDAYRPYSNNISAPLVNENDEIVIDQNILDWIDTTKEYADKGYNNKTSLWDSQWSADQGPNGKVFGFFYSTWGINFTLEGNSLADANAEKALGNGLYGQYAVTEGPASYYWGGSWLCGATGTDNPYLVKRIMQTMTCSRTVSKHLTLDTLDYTNNKVAMTEIAEDESYGSDFLGGQNHIAMFAESADKIDMSNISKYDQGINENIQGAFADYFAGSVTKEKAWENFYTNIAEVYPNLKKAA